MWNASTNTTVDGNTFVDCQREIALGLIERTPNDHSGGLVKNNFISRTIVGDSAIYVADSPNTQVLHNSIFIAGTYANPIEYRFPHTTGVVIANNVLDGNIAAPTAPRARSVATTRRQPPRSSSIRQPAISTSRPRRVHCLTRWLLRRPRLASTGTVTPAPAGSTDIGADEYATGSTPTAPNAPTNLRIVRY
jgi:hypothetical protein